MSVEMKGKENDTKPAYEDNTTRIKAGFAKSIHENDIEPASAIADDLLPGEQVIAMYG